MSESVEQLETDRPYGSRIRARTGLMRHEVVVNRRGFGFERKGSLARVCRYSTEGSSIATATQGADTGVADVDARWRLGEVGRSRNVAGPPRRPELVDLRADLEARPQGFDSERFSDLCTGVGDDEARPEFSLPPDAGCRSFCERRADRDACCLVNEFVVRHWGPFASDGGSCGIQEDGLHDRVSHLHGREVVCGER